MQITKPRKKSTYSDAVGKKLPGLAEAGGHPAGKPAAPGVTTAPLPHPPPPLPPPGTPKLNLAPGTRPIIGEEKVRRMVLYLHVYTCTCVCVHVH